MILPKFFNLKDFENLSDLPNIPKIQYFGLVCLTSSDMTKSLDLLDAPQGLMKETLDLPNSARLPNLSD